MKTSSIASTLFSLVAVLALPAAAAPVATAAAVEDISHLTARTNNVEVFVCTGTNFSGTCETLFDPQLTCYDLTGQTFFHNTRSFGPQKGAFCRIFSDAHCTQFVTNTFYVFPGVTTFGDDNAHMGSFFCQNGPAPN